MLSLMRKRPDPTTHWGYKNLFTRKKELTIQEGGMIEHSPVSGQWKVLGWRMYDMSLVEIGSLFASQMEGHYFQKILLGGGRSGWKWT